MSIYVDQRYGENVCIATEEGDSICGNDNYCDIPIEDSKADSIWHVVHEREVYDDECLEGLAEAIGFMDVVALRDHAEKMVERLEAEA